MIKILLNFDVNLNYPWLHWIVSIYMEIKVVESKHWEEIKNIYQLGIDSGIATFETAPPEDFDHWLQKIDANNSFIILENKIILGWASLSKVSTRSVYQGVGEISIYVHPEHKGRKVGESLYKHLEKNAKEAGYWTLQAQLFTSNIVSKAFFEKQGFRQVGIREKIGQLDSNWVDNYLYEKNFN